jgi:hypothetical protein
LVLSRSYSHTRDNHPPSFHPIMGGRGKEDKSTNHGGRGRGRLGHHGGREAVTPAVTRHTSTGVHGRIDYTSDQVERLTTQSPSTPHGVHSRISYTSSQLDRPTPRSPPRPHGEPELTITVHTGPQRRGTSLVEEYGYKLEDVEEPDTEGDNRSTQSGEIDLEAVEAADEKGEETRMSGKSRAVTPTSCHQTLSDCLRRDPPDDDDEDQSPDTPSISTHSSRETWESSQVWKQPPKAAPTEGGGCCGSTPVKGRRWEPWIPDHNGINTEPGTAIRRDRYRHHHVGTRGQSGSAGPRATLRHNA